MSDRTRGALLVVAASLGFATLGTLAGIAYQAGMSPAAFVTLRATIGALLLGALQLARPQPWTSLAALERRQQGMLATAIVANGAFNLAMFAAFGVMAVGIVLAIYFTYPILVWLASVVLGREGVTVARSLGLLLALVGVMLILGERLQGAHAVPLGLALAAAAAILQASYIVASRHGFPAVPAEQAITLVLLGGAAMGAGLVIMTTGMQGFGGEWIGSTTPWLAVLAAGLLGTAAAKVWVLRGLRLLGGTRTAVLMLIEPVGGVILAALVLGQSMTIAEAAGGLVILAAALLVQRPARARTSGAE